MATDFLKAIKERRSYYEIGDQKDVSEERIEEIIEEAVLHTPSAFNSQSARVVVLFNDHHKKLWDLTKETLREIIPKNDYGSTEVKINTSFRSGYCTVLFFEDVEVIESLQDKYDLYKDKFPLWSMQSNGMLQHVVWTALEDEGLGASLQHYNPLIDEKVKEEWEIPDHWTLMAQMPVGSKEGKPGEKEFESIDQRLKVFE
ncbi:nitroreductase family protein [Haloplasma contractile]|uniref:nitroreductase family protein n=1 Tax=Haloplasma contractile TaxID=471825 RepID=UPI00058FD1D0